MMDCLIVWAALGPVLAFIAGAVVVAWWDDEEEEALPPWHPGPVRGTVLGMPGPAVPFESLGRDMPSWTRSAGRHAGGYSPTRTRSCVQCGRKEDRP